MATDESTLQDCDASCTPPTWDMVEELAIAKCLGLDDAYKSLPVRPQKGYCKVDSKVMAKVMKNPSGGPNAVCNFYNQDCTLTEWSPWTSCSVPRCSYKHTHGGQRTRSRQVKEPAKGMGRPCNVFQTKQTLPCNTTTNVSRYLGDSNFQLGTLLTPTQFVRFEKNVYAQLPSIHPIVGSPELHRVKPVKTLELTSNLGGTGGSSTMHGFTFEALVYIPSSPLQNQTNVTLWSHQTTNNDSPGFISIENLASPSSSSGSNVSIKFSPPVLKDSATSFDSLKYPSKLKVLDEGKHAAPHNVSPPKLSDVVRPNQWFHLACRADSQPSNNNTPYLQVLVNGHATAKQTVQGSTAITPATKGHHFLGMDMKADGTPIGVNVAHPNNAPQFTMYNVRVWGTARPTNSIQNEVGLYMDAHSFAADGLSNDIDMAISSNVNPQKLQGTDLIVDTAQKEKVVFFQVQSSSQKRVHVPFPTLTDAPQNDTQPIQQLVQSNSSWTQNNVPPHEPATGHDKQGNKHVAKLPVQIFRYLVTYIHIHDCNPVNCKIKCPKADGSGGTPIGGCSQTCGGGVQLRKCKIIQYPKEGGRPCPTRSQDYYRYVPCNMQSCQDCILESKSEFLRCCQNDPSCWTACNAPCNGTQYGYRRIIQHAGPNGKPCSQFDRRVSRPCCPNCKCKVCPVGPKGTVCSHRGKCIKSKNQSEGYCVCHEGYAGVNCAIQCPRGWNGHVCSGQGTCTTSMSPRNFFSNDNQTPSVILLFDPSSKKELNPDYVSKALTRRLFHCVTASASVTKFQSMAPLIGQHAMSITISSSSGSVSRFDSGALTQDYQSHQETPADVFAQVSWSVSCWVRVNGGTPHGQIILWRLVAPHDDTHDLRIGLDLGTNKIYGQAQHSVQPSISLADQLATAGDWSQVALTFDMTQNKWQAYLNGQPITQPQTLHTASWWSSTKGTRRIYTHLLDVSEVSVQNTVHIGMDTFAGFLHTTTTAASNQPAKPLNGQDIQHMYTTQRNLSAQGYFPLSSIPSPPSSFFLFGDPPSAPSSVQQLRPIAATNHMYSQLFALGITSHKALQWNTSISPVVSHHVVPQFNFPKSTTGQPILQTSSSPSTKGFFCQSHTYGLWVNMSTTQPSNAWIPARSSSNHKVQPFAVSLFRVYSTTSPYPDLGLVLSPQEGYVYMQGNPHVATQQKPVSRVALNLGLVFTSSSSSSSSSSWHHFLVVSNHETKTNTLYVDGQAVGSDTLHPAPWWCHYQHAHGHNVEMGQQFDVSLPNSDTTATSKTSAKVHAAWDGLMFHSHVVYSSTDVHSLYQHQKSTPSGSTHHLRATSMCRCLPGFYGDACEKGGKCLVTQMQKPNQKQPLAVYQLHEGFTQQQCEMMGVATQGSPHQRYPANPSKKQQEPLLMFTSPGFLMFNRVSLQPLSIDHMFYWQPQNVLKWFRESTFIYRMQALFAHTYQGNVPSSFFSLFTEESLRKQLNASRVMQFVPMLFTAFALGYTYGQDGKASTKMSYSHWLELSAILNLQVNCGSVHQVLGPPEMRQDGFEFRSQTGWTYVKDLIADSGLNKQDLWSLWSELAPVYAFRGCIRSPLQDPTSGKQLYAGIRTVPGTGGDSTRNAKPLAKMIYVLYRSSESFTYPSHTIDPARSIEIQGAALAFSTANKKPSDDDVQVVDIAYPTFGGFHGTVIPSNVSHERIQALAQELGNRDKCYNSPNTIYPWSWTVNTRQQYIKMAQSADKADDSGDEPTQQGDFQKGIQLGMEPNTHFPDLNGKYPQYLADMMNAQCMTFQSKCMPILDDRAMKVMCDGSNDPNQPFDAYVYMTPTEAKNKAGISNAKTTGWYFVRNTTTQKGLCTDLPGCSDAERCRTNIQLGTRLTHIKRDQDTTDVSWRYQCPGSGSTLHSMEPCLQETRRVWWNWWSDTTKQLWGDMLLDVGVSRTTTTDESGSTVKSPDFSQLNRIDESVGKSKANALIRRLNSQCDPGNRCQTLNSNGDGFYFKVSSDGHGQWTYGRKITTSNKCKHSNTTQRQKYCRTMRDRMCSLGLVYTGNVNGSCFCPLSFGEMSTRTEQRMQLPYFIGVFSGKLQNDVQWAALQHGNRYATKCQVSFAQDSWMHQNYYLQFNELFATENKSPHGYVTFRNRISQTSSATVTVWAQLPDQPSQRYTKTIDTIGLWYLQGKGSNSGIGLRYNLQQAQFEVYYDGDHYAVPDSGILSADTFWHHVAVRVNPASSTSGPSIDLFIDGTTQSKWRHIRIPGDDNPQPIHVGGELDGVDRSKWMQQPRSSILGADTPQASGNVYIGGLHSFRLYTDVLSKDDIQKDMCQVRSPTITAGLKQAFSFNTGDGTILPSDPSPSVGTLSIDQEKQLACPPGYTFSTQSDSGGETYTVCKKESA